MFVLFAETKYSNFEQRFDDFFEMQEKIKELTKFGFENIKYQFDI